MQNKGKSNGVWEKALVKNYIYVINAVKLFWFLWKLKELEPNLFYLIDQSVVCLAFRKIQWWWQKGTEFLYNMYFQFNNTLRNNKFF